MLFIVVLALRRYAGYVSRNVGIMMAGLVDALVGAIRARRG
jgi:hypothetical protein